jgi:hypothetical protein
MCLISYAQLLEYPGRPSLSTLDNNTSNPKPGLLEYIPAVQTRPFNITSANSISASTDLTSSFDTSSNGSSSPVGAGGGKVGLAACWEEELSVDAAPEQLVESDALLLLELLQLPGGFARYKVSVSCRCCLHYFCNGSCSNWLGEPSNPEGSQRLMGPLHACVRDIEELERCVRGWI